MFTPKKIQLEKVNSPVTSVFCEWISWKNVWRQLPSSVCAASCVQEFLDSGGYHLAAITRTITPVPYHFIITVVVPYLIILFNSLWLTRRSGAGRCTLRPANERQCYFVMTSLIGWPHTISTSRSGASRCSLWPANERWRYFVMTFLIGWARTTSTGTWSSSKLQWLEKYDDKVPA